MLDETKTGSANHNLGVTNDHFFVTCAPEVATSLVLVKNNRCTGALMSSTGQP
jgi:hypothetical protein